MADNQDNSAGPSIPPKLVIKPQGAPAQPAPASSASGSGQPPQPATVRMRVPAPSPAPTAETPKKATSKIPLSEAVSGQGSPVKTIRLKPATPPPSVTVPLDARGGAITPPASPPSSAAETAEKRKTSRISLEAVLTPESATGGDAGPKTIRLKKPSEMATVKVGQSAPATPVKGDTSTIAAEPAEPRKGTQPIPPEEPAEAEEGGATRRKTIRVKRPSGGGRVDVGEEGAAAPAAEADLEAVPEIEDRPHGIFVFGAVAAVLVALVLIYVLAAQAFGPHVCLTELSYGSPELDLAWPGKITSGR